VLELPIATDPRLCRASGYFRDVFGGPKQFLDLHFIARFSPLLLEGTAIVTERQHARTDKAGYVCVDLVRCGEYNVTLESMEDTIRQVKVPDSASVNLPDLLFPVVESVALAPVGPYAVAVGADLVLTPTVITSSGVPLVGIAEQDVRWYSSDPSVLAVMPSGTTVTLRGLAAGSAELRVERLDTSVIRIPDTAIAGQPVVVTVT
jgi:hypothetical protein